MDVDVSFASASRVRKSAVWSLGLGEVGLDYFSREVMSASLRRAASFLCPTTHGRLVRAVADASAGLGAEDQDVRDELETALQLLIAYGDLLYLPVDEDGASSRRVFLGPPSFVQRTSDALLLVGVRPDGAAFIDDEWASQIDYAGHTRTLRIADIANVSALLGSAGIAPLTLAQWLRVPRTKLPSELVAEYGARLQSGRPSGNVESLRVLDHATPTTYYRGRWRSPKSSDTGTYIARRPQAYGADLWCFAHLVEGQLTRFIDLPVRDGISLGRDEAWRLQAALDATLGHPQHLRIRTGQQPGTSLIDLFSPVPSWAQRYLDTVGIPVGRGSGSLFTYALDGAETSSVADFFSTELWLTPTDH